MQPVKPARVRCPTCGESHLWSTDNPFRPFCSERCKNVDLGAWSAGQYAIPVGSSLENDDTDGQNSN